MFAGTVFLLDNVTGPRKTRDPEPENGDSLLWSAVTTTGYCYGVVSYEASHSRWPFSDLLCVPICVLTILIHSLDFSGKN
jgi:hypothetical protein